MTRSALRVFHCASRSSGIQVRASGFSHSAPKRRPIFHAHDSKQCRGRGKLALRPRCFCASIGPDQGERPVIANSCGTQKRVDLPDARPSARLRGMEDLFIANSSGFQKRFDLPDARPSACLRRRADIFPDPTRSTRLSFVRSIRINFPYPASNFRMPEPKQVPSSL